MAVSKKINFFINLIIIIYSSAVAAEPIPNDIRVHKNWKLLPERGSCGASLSIRIIGGTNATLGKYPWIARLQFTHGKNETELVYNCAGSMITTRYILTAAHCFQAIREYRLTKVRLGEYQGSTKIDCQNGICAPPVQDLDVESYVCHENFNLETYHNDICLVRTQDPITLNSFVRPICLPTYEYFTAQTYDNMKMEAAGWGVTNLVNYTTSDVLQFVLMPVVPLVMCQDLYTGEFEINDKQVCAGGEIGKDTCAGDSGGPLMKQFSVEGPPNYFLIGIVSFGPEKCGESVIPGVNTRVDKFITWILDNMKE